METVFLHSKHQVKWWRQFPAGEPVWGNYRFVFGPNPGAYDHLVIFDRPAGWMRRTCRFDRTIHVASEPNSVRTYEPNFLDQFAWCRTLDPDCPHPGAIHGAPGLDWHVGMTHGLGWTALRALFDAPRTKLLSVISSNITATEGHRRRLGFTQALKAHFGDRIDFYGRGIRDMEDKIEALSGYRFHIAIENSCYPNYFSEKLTDPLIAGCHPIYFGCPNVEDYFEQEAFNRIDIEDLPGSIATIEQLIRTDADLLSKPARREARDQVFQNYNLIPLIVDTIEQVKHRPAPRPSHPLTRLGWLGSNPQNSRWWKALRPLARR